MKILKEDINNMVKESIKRLIKESSWNDGYTVALDFDGTCVKHRYPYVGEDIGAVPVLKKFVESGNHIILDTMRSHRPVYNRHTGEMIVKDPLQDAIDWFEKNGIELYGVQSHPTQKDWTDSTKIDADFSIDDRNMMAPLKRDEYGRRYIDWVRVEEWMAENGLIDDDEEDYSDEMSDEELRRLLMAAEGEEDEED